MNASVYTYAMFVLLIFCLEICFFQYQHLTLDISLYAAPESSKWTFFCQEVFQGRLWSGSSSLLNTAISTAGLKFWLYEVLIHTIHLVHLIIHTNFTLLLFSWTLIWIEDKRTQNLDKIWSFLCINNMVFTCMSLLHYYTTVCLGRNLKDHIVWNPPALG